MSTVLITGGTGAIGSALAAEFAKTDDVIITYNTRADEAKRLCGELRCEAVRCDVSDSAGVNAAVEKVLDSYGHIDVLINNAGISRIKLLTDTSDEDWREIIGVNLTGCFNMTRAVIPRMINRRKGAVINISSVWGVHGASCEAAYSASKAGIIGLTKALAKELGASGITVNALAPGVIESPMNSSRLSAEELSALAEDTPLMRLGSPAEVAHAARFLAENGFVTGQILGVDGGFC